MLKFRNPFFAIMLILTTIFAQTTHADNVFRSKTNSNLEQSNQYIPTALKPAIAKVRQLQAEYLNQVTNHLRQIKQNDSGLISISLLLLSFLYGLLHAAGPGHGKAVISAYLLSNKAQVKQGIQLAFFASMLQAVTAIILVFSGLFLFNNSIRQINQNFAVFERLSYLLILLLGFYLLISAIIKLVKHNPNSKHHTHSEHCGCGHNHIPAPQNHTQSLKQKILTVLSIGIRPCTGALIILILAHSLELYWTAIIATFLMAIGTFTTISLIAMFAVSFQKATLYLTKKYKVASSQTLFKIGIIIKIFVGLLIFLIGLLLFLATSPFAATL